MPDPNFHLLLGVFGLSVSSQVESLALLSAPYSIWGVISTAELQKLSQTGQWENLLSEAVEDLQS